MSMHTFINRIFRTGLLGAMLWLLLPLALLSCDRPDAEVDVSLTSDYRGIAEAIRSGGQTLSETLSLIEAAVAGGFADQAAADKLLQQAVAAMGGTVEEKLSLIEAAVKSQTAGLETKLELIGAAAAVGFADAAAQQSLIAAAIASVAGEAGEKLAAVETAVQGQTASLAMKLGLIEEAVKEGLSDEKGGWELLQKALDALGEDAAVRLAAIAEAMASQAAGLSAKLDLLSEAIKKELADVQASFALVQQAVEVLDGTVDEKLAAVDTAVQRQGLSLEAKLGLIEAAVTAGFADAAAQEALLLKAIEGLGGTAETKLAAIEAAVKNQAATLSSKLGLIETAVTAGFAADTVQSALIRKALAALSGTTAEKLGAIDTAMTRQTASLATKLEAIQQTYADSLANAGEALALIEKAVSVLDTVEARKVLQKLRSIESTSLNSLIVEALNNIKRAIQGLHDYKEILAAIETAIEDLDIPITLEFEDFVTLDATSGEPLLVIGDTIGGLRVPYLLPSDNYKVEATGSDGAEVTVEPDPDDPLRGYLRISANWKDEEQSKVVELTISSPFKSETYTMNLVRERLEADPKNQDKNLNYDEFFDETRPLIFTYKTNTPGIVTIPDSSKSWVRLLYASSNADGHTPDTIKIAVDRNMGFYLRRTGVTVTNRVSTDILTFLIVQDYNSTIIDFAANNQSLASAFVGDTLHINFNKDGYISMAEAAAVTSLDSLFGKSLKAGANYNSFDEFQYFTGIDTIPAGSFHNWNNLTSITLPSSIKVIEGGYGNEDGPFTACPKLESIKGTFPVDSKVRVYDNQLLVYDKKLLKVAETATSVTIPSGVEIIGSKAFYKSNVGSITIPSSVKTIRDRAFEYSQVETVTFAVNAGTGLAYVDSLAENSFAHCFKLKYFEGPENGTSTIRVTPDQLCLCRDTTLYAFAMGSRRTEYAIPESAGVRRLAAYVFSAVSSNSSETNPSADPSAVQWQKIGLPSTLTDIGDHAFSAQKANMEVWFKGENPPKVVAGAFDDVSKITFEVPAVKKSDGTVDQIATDQRINQFKAVLGNSASILSYSEWYAFEKILIVSTIPRKQAYDPNVNVQRDWLPNEHIAVLYEVGGVRKRADARIVSVDEEGKATIRLEVDKNVQNGTSCSLVYPLSAAKDDNTGPKSYSSMANSQDGTLAHCLDVYEGSGTIQTGDAPALRISESEPLKPLYGLLKLVLQFTGGGGPCDVKTLVVKYNDLTVTIDAEEVLNTFYLSMLPLNGGSIALEGITTSNLHYPHNFSNETIEAGKYYERTIYLTPQ